KVTYVTNGTAIGGLVNGATYYTLATDANKIQLLPSYASLGSGSFNQINNAADTIGRNDGGNWATDGFPAGKQIVIAGTANNNRTLTILSVSGNTLSFAGDVLANESNHAATLRGTALPLSPDKTGGAGVQHELVRQTLGALQAGTTYYVVN